MRPTVMQIVEAAAAVTYVPRDVILGEARDQLSAEARQIVFRVALDVGHGQAATARALGKDHTTVRWGAMKIASRAREDAALDGLIRRVRAKLYARSDSADAEPAEGNMRAAAGSPKASRSAPRTVAASTRNANTRAAAGSAKSESPRAGNDQLLEQILDASAAACGVPLRYITKRTNAQSYATARQITTGLAREHGIPLETISLRLERDEQGLVQGLASLENKRRHLNGVNDAWSAARTNLRALLDGREIDRVHEPGGTVEQGVSQRHETMTATAAALVLPTRKLLRDDLELVWRGGVYSLRKKAGR